jgi:ankyrin repeat protein
VARKKGERLLAACTRKDAAAALRFISEGAELDCVDVDGWSPLVIASCYEELDGVAARLIGAGAKLDRVDTFGNSALILACGDKRAATALLLIEAGAALNPVNRDGKSVLDYTDQDGLEAVAAAIRARGGLTGAELAAAARP